MALVQMAVPNSCEDGKTSIAFHMQSTSAKAGGCDGRLVVHSRELTSTKADHLQLQPYSSAHRELGFVHSSYGVSSDEALQANIRSIDKCVSDVPPPPRAWLSSTQCYF